MAAYVNKRTHQIEVQANEVSISVKPYSVQIRFTDRDQFYLYIAEKGETWAVNDVPIGILIDALKPFIKRQIQKAKGKRDG